MQYKRGDPVAALGLFRRDALGCLSLSLVLQNGKFGTRRDPARAAELKKRTRARISYTTAECS
jgi:hypothetical protein